MHIRFKMMYMHPMSVVGVLNTDTCEVERQLWVEFLNDNRWVKHYSNFNVESGAIKLQLLFELMKGVVYCSENRLYYRGMEVFTARQDDSIIYVGDLLTVCLKDKERFKLGHIGIHYAEKLGNFYKVQLLMVLRDDYIANNFVDLSFSLVFSGHEFIGVNDYNIYMHPGDVSNIEVHRPVSNIIKAKLSLVG